MKKIPWNKYDCALLLEMLLKIENKEIEKSIAIKDLSEAMRKQAERNGITADPTFRNQNGILLQYLSLLYVFSNGKKGLKKEASVQFKNIVDIYKKNKLEYFQILEEAKARLNVEKTSNISYQAQAYEKENFNEDGFKQNHKNVYMKLKSIASVYDDPDGMNINKILGYLNDEIDEITLSKFLDSVSWAKKLDDKKYTFSPRLIENVNHDTSISANFDKYKYTYVLERRFGGGMRFDSIDLDNFREIYEDTYSELLKIDDQILKSQLMTCGFIFEGKLFSANGTINPNAKSAIFSYIENSFSAGNQVIFYQSIYDDLSDVLECCYSLKNVEMFKEYLKFVAGDLYYFFADYISKNKEIEVNVDDELERLLKGTNKPLSYDEIYSGLAHISKDKIYQTIRANEKILLDEKEHYFHIDTFEISKHELDRIDSIITSEIDNDGFAIWGNVFSKISDLMPMFIENNPYLSPIGIRNSLALFLSNKYSFNANVISTVNSNLTNSDIFKIYAEHHDEFSDADLCNLSKMLESVVNYAAILDVSVRVKKDLFVCKTKVHFDVHEIDKAISTYISSGVLPIKEIDSFLVFPNTGYEWNQFLLESYLIQYSRDYRLFNNGMSLNDVSGAVGKNDGSVKDFCMACSIVLAEQNMDLNKDRALEILVELGLLNRKRYKDIDTAITNAKLIRVRKERR